MALFRRKDKKKDLLAELATKPASFHMGLLEGDVRNIVTEYLTAMFTSNPDQLPMERMEEGLYKAKCRSIEKEHDAGLSRTVHNLTLISIKPVEYDNRFMYMISSLSYEIEYQIKGTICLAGQIFPYAIHKKASFVFSLDGRMGYLLSGCFDDTYVE